MLEAVKTALGISSDVYNEEFTILIASAKADLQQVGIVVIEDTDPLMITAVSLYCQANRGTDVEKRLAFGKMYVEKKINLMRDVKYTEAVTE